MLTSLLRPVADAVLRHAIADQKKVIADLRAYTHIIDANLAEKTREAAGAQAAVAECARELANVRGACKRLGDQLVAAEEHVRRILVERDQLRADLAAVNGEVKGEAGDRATSDGEAGATTEPLPATRGEVRRVA